MTTTAEVTRAMTQKLGPTLNLTATQIAQAQRKLQEQLIRTQVQMQAQIILSSSTRIALDRQLYGTWRHLTHRIRTLLHRVALVGQRACHWPVER